MLIFVFFICLEKGLTFISLVFLCPEQIILTVINVFENGVCLGFYWLKIDPFVRGLNEH